MRCRRGLWTTAQACVKPGKGLVPHLPGRRPRGKSKAAQLAACQSPGAGLFPSTMFFQSSGGPFLSYGGGWTAPCFKNT